MVRGWWRGPGVSELNPTYTRIIPEVFPNELCSPVLKTALLTCHVRPPSFVSANVPRAPTMYPCGADRAFK